MGLTRAQPCQAVIHTRQKLDISERCACAVLDVAGSSLRYQAQPVDDSERRLAMIRLAKQYGCYGYRKVTALLRLEGWRVNHKKVERLWDEEGLQLPRRHKKRKRLYHKNSSIIRLRTIHPNHIWAINFVHDKLGNGSSYKMLTVLDEYTREALCLAVRSKMSANDVLETLHLLFMKHGKPEFIRSDNGPEFIATHLQDWLKRICIKPTQVYLGSPWKCGGIRKQCGTMFSGNMV